MRAAFQRLVPVCGRRFRPHCMHAAGTLSIAAGCGPASPSALFGRMFLPGEAAGTRLCGPRRSCQQGPIRGAAAGQWPLGGPPLPGRSCAGGWWHHSGRREPSGCRASWAHQPLLGPPPSWSPSGSCCGRAAAGRGGARPWRIRQAPACIQGHPQQGGYLASFCRQNCPTRSRQLPGGHGAIVPFLPRLLRGSSRDAAAHGGGESGRGQRSGLATLRGPGLAGFLASFGASHGSSWHAARGAGSHHGGRPVYGREEGHRGPSWQWGAVSTSLSASSSTSACPTRCGGLHPGCHWLGLVHLRAWTRSGQPIGQRC